MIQVRVAQQRAAMDTLDKVQQGAQAPEERS